MINNIINFFYSIIVSIRNIFIWLPVIWRDRDWSEGFMWIILNTKLRKMERFFNRDDLMSVHPEKELRRLKEARILTDRIITDEYNPDECSKIKDKYQVRYYTKYIPEKDHYIHCTEVGNGTEKDYRREMRRHFEHEWYLKKQDVRRLGEILEKHSFRWWS